MSEQSRPGLDASLLRAWHDFVASRPTPFTIPGHKRRGDRIDQDLGRLLEGDVPLFGGIAPVKRASAALAESEARGARLWEADWCAYSTGGSTHANQAMALALGRPGDTVLVTRTAHRSTLLGIVLAGLRPVWLPSLLDPALGIPTGMDLAALRHALDAHPGAVAVLCVEPSYLGTISDLPEVVRIAHARDVPVVVDQAWGAHLGFHPDYPRHALQLGADAMVLSAHKTLPAYSQASVVAARTARLDRARLQRAFEAAATTSPSGTILASIDGARALLGSPLGAQLLGRLRLLVDDARGRLRGMTGVVLPGPEDFAPGRFDPAKLVLLLSGTGRSGNELEDHLLAAGLGVELADRDTLVPVITLADDQESIDTLVTGVLSAAGGRGAPLRPPAALTAWKQEIPPAPVTPREAFFAPHRTVPAPDAVGRVCAEVIAPYPPGIPVLVPGEMVTAGALEQLAGAAQAGVRIAYAADPSMRTVQVLA